MQEMKANLSYLIKLLATHCVLDIYATEWWCTLKRTRDHPCEEQNVTIFVVIMIAFCKVL